MSATARNQKLLKAVGARIRKVREAAGMTAATLAAKASVSRSHLSEVETGGAHLSVSALHAIAKALKVSVGHLLGE